MNERPWFASWVWDLSVLAAGVLLALFGEPDVKRLGEWILAGASIGIYASRRPSSGGDGPGGGRGSGPIDPGLMTTLFGGLGAAAHRLTKLAHTTGIAVVALVTFTLAGYAGALVETSCTPTTQEVKAGVAGGEGLCKLIESLTDAGVLETICATAPEIEQITKLLGRTPTDAEIIHGTLKMRRESATRPSGAL